MKFTAKFLIALLTAIFIASLFLTENSEWSWESNAAVVSRNK